MREPRKIPDEIIDRAVDIWCRALANPRFDNGDSSNIGGMATIMATTNAIHAEMAVEGGIGEAIERFRKILGDKLRYNRDHEGEKTGKLCYEGQPGQYAETVYFDSHLGCDYGPGKTLSEAATAAGVPHDLFSWKSTIYINEDSVEASFGYGAEHVCHYPLGEGRWLVTTIRARGEALEIIKRAVLDGRLTELNMEKA